MKVLTFSQFKNCFLAIFEIAKIGLWTKNFFHEIELFDFTSFFGLYFFKFFGPLCIVLFLTKIPNFKCNGISKLDWSRSLSIILNWLKIFKKINGGKNWLFTVCKKHQHCHKAKITHFLFQSVSVNGVSKLECLPACLHLCIFYICII